MSHAAKFYFNKTIRDHRTALSKVDKNTAEAVLATAIIICHHTWISGYSTSDELYEIPLQKYYMARGIQAIFDQMWPWLRGSAYLWYIERQPNPEPTENFSQTPWMASVQEDLTGLSETFQNDTTPAKDKSIYQKATDELSSMCRVIEFGLEKLNIPKRVATMPIRLPGWFLELVELRDPRALCLLARNLALLKVIDPVWWLHGTGPSQRVADKVIAGIGNMLPTEWLWAMEPPRDVISGFIRP